MSIRNKALFWSKKKKFIKKFFNFKYFSIEKIGAPFKDNGKISLVMIKGKFFDEKMTSFTSKARYTSSDLTDIIFSDNRKSIKTDIICPICNCGTIDLRQKKKDIDERVVMHVGNDYSFVCSNKKCFCLYTYHNRFMYID